MADMHMCKHMTGTTNQNIGIITRGQGITLLNFQIKDIKHKNEENPKTNVTLGFINRTFRI